MCKYEIQQLLVESNGITEEEKVASDHKSEYQHAVILDNQNKRKRERQAQGNSKGKELLQRKGNYHILVV